MSPAERVSAVKGMRDLLAPASAKWQFVERTCRSILHQTGYQEIRTPLLEYTALFGRAIGDTTDIVEKEMYTFEDRDGRSVTLRPEGTASAVRAYLEHAAGEQEPIVKWYYLGAMFRHERPQRGRLRQFHQIGAEVFGVAEPMIDAEMMAMTWRMVCELGVASPTLRVSSLGCRDCRSEFRTQLLAFVVPRVESFCPDCRRRMQSNPLRLLDCKRSECVAARQGAPSTLDTLCATCSTHFATVRQYSKELGTPVEVDRSLVRGLDYYTRTTFEITSAGAEVGAQNAILGGGRYDGLVADLGGPNVPAIGFALGIERTVLAMTADEAQYVEPLAVFLVAMGDAARSFALKTAEELRRAGLRIDLDARGGSVKSQMRRADKLGAKVVLIVGDNELSKGTVIVKTMEQGTQREVLVADLLPALQGVFHSSSKTSSF